MPKRLPQPAQFQFVVKTRVRKGDKPTSAEVKYAVERWIESEPGPWPDAKISVIIWDGGKQREVTEIDDSPRGQQLRETLRRGLPRARFRIVKMGSA